MAIRSENIILDEACKQGYPAVVKEKSFVAGQLRVLLALPDGTEIIASRFGMNANIQPGQQISWCFDPKNAAIVDRNAADRDAVDRDAVGRNAAKAEGTSASGGNL